MASAESLEPILIPAILSTNSLSHSTILVQHWTEEMAKLQTTIQRIIDSNAFCNSLCNHLSDTITQLNRNYDHDLALSVFPHCTIFQAHLKHNWAELQLSDTSAQRRILVDNFELMLNECRAAVDACGASESHRIVKRFRIMLVVLKKLRATMVEAGLAGAPQDDFTFDSVTQPYSRVGQPVAVLVAAPAGSMVALDCSSSEMEAFFKSFGISRMASSSILYAVEESPRKRCQAAAVVGNPTTMMIQKSKYTPNAPF